MLKLIAVLTWLVAVAAVLAVLSGGSEESTISKKD